MAEYKPVFIGGFRSGTTLLVNLMGMHDQAAPWFETKMLCEALRWLYVLKHPEEEQFERQYINPPEPAGFTAEAVRARMEFDLRSTLDRISGAQHSGKAAHEQYSIGFDCLSYDLESALVLLDQWEQATAGAPDYETVSKATGELINQLGAAHSVGQNKPLWINKTPEISRFADELRDCLGECRVIYMVRNGLSVVESAKKLGWGDVGMLAHNWCALLEKTRSAMAQQKQDYREIRYEDLVTDPQAVLGELLAFSGLENQAGEIVAQYARHFDENAFDRSKINRKSSLTDEELAEFSSVAGVLQNELGYTE